eukprot:TRINITY_DN14740_c0_g1_i1.p3 TRINITY_DN14740_c0_g1~~TRINITY_DN14740_c0_g1_i1.p3  ORF type:complete len:357 (-),score=34.76 TRINITY_DN14740_c0_g1_i1:424-1494(-)
MTLSHSTVLLNSTSTSLEADCIVLCTKLVPECRDFQQHLCNITKIEGGITNLLLKVQQGDCAVTIRIFGDNTNLFIDRERELQVLLQITGYGFGAKVLATFGNGRIEEYLDAYTLTPKDVTEPLLSGRIAKKLYQYHQLKIDEVKKPMLWETIGKWLRQAEQLNFKDCEDSQRKFEQLDFNQMRTEIQQTQELCDRCDSPVVYCHNDLLSGNILLIKRENQDKYDKHASDLQFIDFEYGCYSYRGFDWGNHFNEWAGFNCDFSLYPNKDQQRRFIRSYLEGYIQNGGQVSENEVEKGLAEVAAFSLASHIYWGVWALLQAKYSPIDFDYFEYSEMRWKQYLIMKEEAQLMVREAFG